MILFIWFYAQKLFRRIRRKKSGLMGREKRPEDGQRGYIGVFSGKGRRNRKTTPFIKKTWPKKYESASSHTMYWFMRQIPIPVNFYALWQAAGSEVLPAVTHFPPQEWQDLATVTERWRECAYHTLRRWRLTRSCNLKLRTGGENLFWGQCCSARKRVRSA